MLEPRPAIRCLVAKLHEGRIIGAGPETLRDRVPTNQDGWPRLVSLEDAASYHQLGFIVMRDPWSEEDLATWERETRAMQQEVERQRKASKWGWGV
jgi:hypothetical protein